MNNKGQNLGFAIIMAAMIFIAGMLFLNHIKDDVTLTRAIGLDCTNVTISDGNKLVCLGVDLTVPIFMVMTLLTAGGFLLSRYLL